MINSQKLSEEYDGAEDRLARFLFGATYRFFLSVASLPLIRIVF
jgi:hypothetical protein